MFGINRRLDSIEHEVVKTQKLVHDMNVKLHAGSYCRESFGNCCTSENEERFSTEQVYEIVEGLSDSFNSLKNNLDFNHIKGAQVQINDRLDKFEENYKRFEVMFNEFKGCIAMTRASIQKEKPSNKKPGRPKKEKAIQSS